VTVGFDGVSVEFGDITALSDVTFSAPAGRVTAVVGGDGSGKTTLLRTLVGLVPVSSGQVRAPAAAEVGYLPAGAGSWKDLTVQENVDFVGYSYGLSGSALTLRADELLERAGLIEARQRLARQLSGGMRTKLGYVLAMLHQPSLLVLDEPSTGVDPVSRVELWRLISETAASGATVVMSTTYMDEAERTSQVLLLSSGAALLFGAPDELISAMPGTVSRVTGPVEPDHAWRRGPAFHQWWPDGNTVAGEQVEPDLADVSIVAELSGLRASGVAQ